MPRPKQTIRIYSEMNVRIFDKNPSKIIFTTYVAHYILVGNYDIIYYM